MKIISKYKDYYDYLQGILGIDTTLVLDRTDYDTSFFYYELLEKADYPLIVKLKIGDYKLNYYLYKGKAYRLDQVLEIPNASYDYQKNVIFTYPVDGKEYYFSTKNENKYGEIANEFYRPKGKKVAFISAYVNSALSVFSNKMSFTSSNEVSFPILDKLETSKILNAEVIWNIIYDELCKLKEGVEPKAISDEQKIINKGFDLKTSFRNIK